MISYLQKKFINYKQYFTDSFTNICNFVHDETGKWMNILDVEETEMLTREGSFPADKFIMKYYPQGIPESVNKTFSQFGENFASGTNGTTEIK